MTKPVYTNPLLYQWQFELLIGVAAFGKSFYLCHEMWLARLKACHMKGIAFEETENE